MSSASGSASVTEAKAPKLIKFAVPFLGIMAAIQGTAPNINSTALVSLTRDLNMSGGAVALAASVQTIALAATVITTGLLADRLGRKKVLLVALLVGAAGGVVSAIAPVSAIYFLGQVIMGVGMGAIYGSSFAYVQTVAKPGKLAGALGVFGATIGLTTLILTFLGGSLAGVNWRLGFLVISVATVLCFIAVPFVLPNVPRLKSSHLDLLGQLLLAVGIIGFLYGISELGRSLTAPTTLIPLIGGAVILALFFVWESKSRSAFYPVRLFRSPIFIAAILAGFSYNFGTAVTFLQSTNLWQYVTGIPTREVALWQVPLVASGIVGALVTGRLMSRGMTNRTALIGGGAVTVIGMVILALSANAKSFVAFLPGTVITGAGLLAISIPFGNLIIKEAPPAQYGPVTSSRTTIGQFFYSIGFAIATVAIDKLTVGGVVGKLTDAGVQPDLVGTAVTSLSMYVQTGKDPSTELGKQAMSDAIPSYASAFTTVILICAALVAIASVVGWLLLGKKGAPVVGSAPANQPSPPANGGTAPSSSTDGGTPASLPTPGT
jgi:MFS family permease